MIWQPGDIALCIDDDWYQFGGGLPDRYPKKGGSYLVTDVILDGPWVFLQLPGFIGVWDADSFTKNEDPPDVEVKRRKYAY